MDRGAVAKRSRRRRKKNPQQEKEPVYFSNDTILEAVKFLNYKNWSQMRFLCHRVNQLIHSNQSKLQAFEVESLSMGEIYYFKSNSIVSFDQGIQPAKAARKWFQDRGYSCDETADMSLREVFPGMDLIEDDSGLHFTIRAFFEKSTEKNMLLTSQAKQMNKMRWGKARKKNRRLLNSVTLESKTPELFSAKFNAQYEFCGPILSHFFRLLHHPAAYFRLEQLKWLKENVCAQEVILSFDYMEYFSSHNEFHSHVSEFLLLDASICARDCIKLNGLHHPKEFVNTLIEKYETLEITKAIPSIVLRQFRLCYYDSEIFKPSFVVQYDPCLYDKRCDSCNIKTYEIPVKLDGSRKIIAQVRLCDKRECLSGDSTVYVRFE